jgi:hypothetical protein
MRKVFREAEYEAGAPISRPGFRVVVTTNLTGSDIQEKLGPLLPLSRCIILNVKSD